MNKLPEHSNGSSLSPYLSPVSVWALAFGCSVGWGAFVMPATTFLPAAGPLGTVLGLIIGAVIMLIIGINYNSLMRRYPNAGGAYTYASSVLGGDHGFLCAWMLLIVYFAVIWANSTALSLIFRFIFGDVLCFGFSYSIAGYTVYLGEVLLSIGIIAAAFAVCVLGKRLSKWAQTLLAVLLFSGICICFIFAVVKRGGFSGLSPAFSNQGSKLSQIFGIVILAPWAYVGFESISHSAGEFRFNIKKSLPIIIAALITGALSYIMLTLCAAMATPDKYANWTEYIRAVGTLEGIDNLPTFLNAKENMGEAGLLILGISAFCGIATGLIGNIIALSRLLFSMSGDGLLPKQFQYKSKKGVPYVAVGFIAAVSLPIPFLGRTAIGWIVDVTTIGAAIVYVYTSICSFATGKREKKRGLQAFGILGTVISLVFVGFYLLPSIWSDKSTLAAESFLILIIWSLLGMVVFRLLMKRDKARQFGKSEVVWIILLFLILLLSIVWIFQTTIGEASDIAQDVCSMQTEQAVKAGLTPDNNIVIDTGNYITERIISFGENVRLNVLIQALLIFCSIAVIFSIFGIIKKREQVIEAERILAEENSRAKSAFLSNMSHDLRTPMNAVTGYTALALKEENLPDNIRDYLVKIDNSGKHLLSLINDILDMSRIESGKAELRCEPADICLLIDEAESLFALQISEKKLTLDASCSQIKDRYVVCDKNRINRILLNLISNAVKFTPAGGTITVELKQTNSENGEAFFILTVADTGIGMSKDFSEHIFDAFERERSSTVSNIQGTGLGMSITKSFTELMGGTIEVETEKGKGTRFTLNLHFPIASEDEISQLTEVVDEKPVNFSGKKLLLVEDNPVNTEIAKMVLSMSGFECDCAENGKIAVEIMEKAAADDYCVILMDVRMPVMNGLEATRAIRAMGGEKSKLPIIAVSANTFEDDRREAFEAGMNDHVSKPLQPEVLIATLRKYIK